MVQRQDPAGAQPGFLQEGLGSSFGQGRAAGKFPAPGLRVRPEARPGHVTGTAAGPHAAETALSEVFVPPDGAWSPRGLDITTDGVVWTPLASGHMASFDRRKCRGPQNGPQAASGKLCPEGWTLYRMPGPQFKGLDPAGSANHA